jgi:uncharacterized protein (TIRG00374 family)
VLESVLAVVQAARQPPQLLAAERIEIMAFIKSLGWFFGSPDPKARRLRWMVQLLFILALFASLFWVIPIQKVVRAILNANPLYFLVGLGLTFISTSLTAVQMKPLIQKQKLPHSTLEILEINLAVKFYSQFMPSSLVGSGVRWYRLAQPGGKVAESLAALAFFRVLETFLTLALGLGFWLVSRGKTTNVNIAWVTAVILAIILGWTLITRYSLILFRWSKKHTGFWLEHPLLKPVVTRFEKFLAAITSYADMPAPGLLLAILAGTLSALAGIVSGTVLAWSVGIQVNFLTMGWIQAVILLATSLPFAVAGGVGIREVTLVALLAAEGINAELALALSFLLFVRGILIGLLGGLLEARRNLRRILRQRRLDAAAALAREPLAEPQDAAPTPER